MQPVLNVAECLLGEITPEMNEFATAYAAKIGEFSADWKPESAELRADNELTLCIHDILERGSN